MSSLISDLLAWDGKSKPAIAQVFVRHVKEEDFLTDILSLLVEPKLQVGASWLLKHGLDNRSFNLSQKQATAVYRCVQRLEQWEAKLHVLQCMPCLTISPSQVKRVKKFCDECLEDKNKFVRAWAYSGLYELAETHPRFQEEVGAKLLEGMETETAGSIKVRIRRALEAGF